MLVLPCKGPVEKHNKMQIKKTTAIARRERFKTGGGPPIRPQRDGLRDLLTVIIENQQPLEGIPDDDHLDSSGGETQQNLILTVCGGVFYPAQIS